MPTKVAVGVFVNDITKMNDVEQFYAAGVYLTLQRRDSRLADSRRGDRFIPCRLPLERIWAPVVEADNLRGRQKFYQDRTLINSDGVIFWLQRLVVEVSELPRPEGSH